MIKTLIPMFVLSAASSVALAQAPAAADLRPPRIAIIDMGEISMKSQVGKSYQTQLDALKTNIDAEGTKKQNELQKMDAEIKALQDELEKQGSVLSAEAADKKRQDIVKKTRDRQAYLEDGQQELQRMREHAQQQADTLNREFQAKIKPHIETVARERKVDILLDSQVAMAVNNEFDISKDVIAKLDASEASKPAAKSAEPPAPKAPAKGPAAPPRKP